MTGPDPQAVSDLDESLTRAIGRVHQARWIILAVTGVILVAAVSVLSVMLLRDQSELQASCHFWKPLTTLPVTVAPPAKVPSEVGVNLVVAARIAYQGQECGPLPPAAPSLLQWAAYYRIPVP